MGFFSSLFESTDTKKRKSHIRNLLVIAAQDGEITGSEVRFLADVAKRMYMPNEEFVDVIKNPSAVSFYPPQIDRERFDQIHDLVLMMMIDGHIDDDEMARCKSFAMQLGFRAVVIDYIVKQVVEGIAEDLAKDAILARIRHLIQS